MYFAHLQSTSIRVLLSQQQTNQLFIFKEVQPTLQILNLQEAKEWSEKNLYEADSFLYPLKVAVNRGLLMKIDEEHFAVVVLISLSKYNLFAIAFCRKSCIILALGKYPLT